MKTPIIGQEAVVPKYGLGRVVSFSDVMPDLHIKVRPYINHYIMKFDPTNVRLVEIKLEKKPVSFKHAFTSEENC